MYTPHDNIKRLRELLPRFYDGVSTPDEEREIAILFRSIPGDSLPEDLQADRRLFANLEDGTAPIQDCDVPADLLANIGKAIDRQETVDKANANGRRAATGNACIRPRRRFRTWSTALAAAASLAIIITLGILFFSGETAPEQSPARPMLAQADATGNAVKAEQAENAEIARIKEKAEMPDKINEAISLEKSNSSNNSNFSNSSNNSNQPAPSYAQEVTDTAQAAEIVESAYGILYAAFTRADSGVEEANSTLTRQIQKLMALR